MPHETPDAMPRGPVPPGPHSHPTPIPADDLLERVRMVLRQEFTDQIEKLKIAERAFSMETKRDRFLKYGGVAVGGAAVGVATTLTIQRIRRGRKPGPTPMMGK
jgi:hypothetical protein